MGDENPMSASTGAIKKKKDDKGRRRDQRSWDNIMRSVSNMSEGDKIAVIQEKYNEIYTELRKSSSTLVAMEKQYAMLQKERDHTQTELTKNILAKAKLESLCRELQKHNKVIKEENITRVKEEEERRREVATNFTEKLNSLTTMMDENKDKSVRLREENMSMTSKLTELYDQFQERESHLTNMNRQMDLQKQLSDTQLKKAQVELENERKLFDQERQALTANLERSEQANRILEANLQSMQDHLEVYKGQYTDFESTMAKSSKVFDAFKAEMAILQKANATLEQERNEYLARWQSCTNSVIQITELHQQTVTDLKVCEKKVPLLERICRQLQAERSAYQKQLVDNNISPVFVPQSQEDQPDVHRPSTSTPPPTTISHTTQKKLSKKERLLVALKSELKVMEDQLKKKVMAKERELTALKSDLKLVMDQRKVATRQQELARENQEAAAKRKEMEDAIAARMEEISLLEDDEPQPGPSSKPDKPIRIAPQLTLRLAKSVPAASRQQKRSADKSSSSSSSGDSILTELSLDTIPLYKTEAVTDINQMDVCLVRESEGHTDLLQPTQDDEQHAEEDQQVEEDPQATTDESEDMQDKSAVTIPLKQSDGKTEINKES